MPNKFSQREFPNLDLNRCINKLIYGAMIKKYTKRGTGQLHPIWFYISDSNSSLLQWISSKKPFTQTRINLKNVTALSDLPTKIVGKPINKFSKLYLVINHGRGQEMVLQFDNIIDKEQWWCGLQYFVLLAINDQRYVLSLLFSIKINF